MRQRVVWTNGPVVRSMIAAHFVTVLMTLGLMVYVLAVVVPEIEGAPIRNRHDSCELIRGIALTSTAHNPRAHLAAQRFIRDTVLSNCNHYARTGK